MIKQTEFKQRRQRLMRQLKSQGNSIAIIPTATEKNRNNDCDFPFRPNSDFYYLTGFNEPEAIAVFIPQKNKGRFVLFCRERDHKMEIWHGRRTGLEGAKSIYGADEVYAIDEVDEVMPKLIENRESIYYTLGKDAAFDNRLIHWVNTVRGKARTGVQSPQAFISLDPLIHDMRLIKSKTEIKLMRKAAEISAKAHIKAMQTCKPGIKEYAVEAEIAHTFTKHGCPNAYNPIVGGGENGCILHYTENNTLLNDGELLLIDAGAELDLYASDITRTFPINGTFSPEQTQIYNIVLKAQLAAIKKIKPGNHWNQPHEAAVKVLTQGLIDIGLLRGELKTLINDNAYQAFYMHRTGHWLGIDVHDVGDYKIDGKWRKFEEGMVLTIEPGLYIAANSKGVNKKWWNIGIRIEDDIVVTKDGYDILSKDTPKTISEIESIMQGHS